MNRRELVLNLLLLSLTAGLAWLIFTSNAQDRLVRVPALVLSREQPDAAADGGQICNAYPHFGQVALMKAIIPPTPTPPPAPPPPAPTPDIEKVLRPFRLLSVCDGTVIIENTATHEGSEQFLSLRQGESIQVHAEGFGPRKLVLLRMQESGAAGTMSAGFSLEGTSTEGELRTGE